jgi:hypothetical protein
VISKNNQTRNNTMENKELLFNLIKKLESGEIRFFGNEKFGYLEDNKNPSIRIYFGKDNQAFKENFYREKKIVN